MLIRETHGRKYRITSICSIYRNHLKTFGTIEMPHGNNKKADENGDN